MVFLASDRVDEGDPELGALLMRAFLRMLQEVEPGPDHIICMNSGVRLAMEGSPLLDDLLGLEQSDPRIWLCGTCLDVVGLKEQVGGGDGVEHSLPRRTAPQRRSRLAALTEESERRSWWLHLTIVLIYDPMAWWPGGPCRQVSAVHNLGQHWARTDCSTGGLR